MKYLLNCTKSMQSSKVSMRGAEHKYQNIVNMNVTIIKKQNINVHAMWRKYVIDMN